MVRCRTDSCSRRHWAVACLASFCSAGGCWTSLPADGDAAGDADAVVEVEAEVEGEARVDAPADAEPPVATWMATFPVWAVRGYGTDFVETSDGGIALVGYAILADAGFGESDAWAMKLDAEQNVLWARLFGGAGAEWVQALAPAPDGGVVFAAVNRSVDPDGDVWLVRLDRHGAVSAERLLHGPGGGGALALEPLPDGGFVVGGHVGDAYAGGDPWVARLDPGLDVLWQRRYAAGVGAVRSVSRAANGDLLVLAAPGAGYDTAGSWLARLDETGGIVWQRQIGDGFGVGSRAGTAETTDGDVVVVGTSSLPGGGAVVLRFDGAGGLRWQKTLGGRWGFDAAPGDRGAALVGAGEEAFLGGPGPNIWLLELSPDGRIAWQRAALGDWIEIASVVKRGRDGSILVLSSETPSWLLKLRPDGTFAGSCPIWQDTWDVPADAALTVAEADFGFVDTTFAPTPVSSRSADVPCPVEPVCPE